MKHKNFTFDKNHFVVEKYRVKLKTQLLRFAPSVDFGDVTLVTSLVISFRYSKKHYSSFFKNDSTSFMESDSRNRFAEILTIIKFDRRLERYGGFSNEVIQMPILIDVFLKINR